MSAAGARPLDGLVARAPAGEPPDRWRGLRAGLRGRVIHLNGFPGSGKRTIGAAIARRLDGRLLDGHATIDAAMALHHPSSPKHWALRRAVTGVVFAAARELPPDVPIVTTGVLFRCDVEDRHALRAVRRLSRSRGAPAVLVNLTMGDGENERRVVDPARDASRKLTDPLALRAIRARYDLLGSRSRRWLAVDVGSLDASEAADAVLEAVRRRVVGWSAP